MPAETYPVDEWRIVERGLTPDIAGRLETIFALSNGFLGVRGAHDDGESVYAPGTFINGFYESWPIQYPEAAFGFATSGQTIVNVPDATKVRVAVDGRELTSAANGATVERVLDMRTGILTREAIWDLDEIRVRVRSRRLASMRYRHLVAMSLDIVVEGAPAKVCVSSGLHPHRDPATTAEKTDPRKANVFGDRVLLSVAHETDQMRIVTAYSTRSSHLGLACGIDHQVDTTNRYDVSHHVEDDVSRVEFSVDAEPGAVFRLTRIVGYHTAATGNAAGLTAGVHHTLDRGLAIGFDSLVESQREYLDDAWAAADIRVIGQPRIQQAIRWNLFQLIQATARVEGTGVPAKGLTSQGYDGHYFWDMDMFLMPFVTYTHPKAARELLRYRYSTLDAARRRASEMSQAGALFPWRTINGEEASAYFPAGTAQYHINAAVMCAVKRYVDVTGDRQFLVDMGAEIVLDTARLWLDLGFFDDDGAFHIHGVTGPDEYTALVNDNTYTNLMAQMHLRYAADVIEWLTVNHPDRLAELAAIVALDDGEANRWRTAANRMTIPYDEELGINPQDAEFLDKEVWDFEATNDDDYPLLLHYHPLVLYRHQVLKQPDVVLAMLARGDAFTTEQKARNFAYYEPLTTDDSSLSVPIQAIIAAEVGAHDIAFRCFEHAAFTDLSDGYGNSVDGVHLASSGALWMSLVQGFAGMRDYDGDLTFDPHLPRDWMGMEFSLSVQGCRIDVELSNESIGLRLSGPHGLTVSVRGSSFELRPDDPVTVGLAPEPVF